MLSAAALLNARMDDEKTAAEKTTATIITTSGKAAVTFPLPVSFSCSSEMGNPA